MDFFHQILGSFKDLVLVVYFCVLLLIPRTGIKLNYLVLQFILALQSSNRSATMSFFYAAYFCYTWFGVENNFGA